MFKTGDTVLYGMDGVCRIEDITTIDVPGIDNNRLYYVISMKNNKGTSYVPVDSGKSKMRKLITLEEAMEVVGRIAEIEPLQPRDRKRPEPEYKQALRTYDCINLIRLIKCIYFRITQRVNEGKKATAVDEKYMDLAENVLYQELGIVLGIPREQVLDFIIKKCDKRL